MEDQAQEPNSSPSQGTERSTEPVRSRWTPKPEQILILESIFNSGMVNPPKEETVRIRKLLEKFGSVGDANVFYWFQNRRSRSRRRQRQIQAGLTGEQPPTTAHVGAIQYDQTTSSDTTISSVCALGFAPPFTPSSCLLGGSSSSSSCGGLAGGEDLFLFSGQMGLPEIEQSRTMTSLLCSSDASDLHFHSGLITVFINGVATEVPRGPIDMKAMFGQDVVLFHSSGVAVPFNEFGFSLQSLHLGESYFLLVESSRQACILRY